ncbi:uncharacterized protein [Anabrus simplex]
MRPVNEFYTDLNNITWGDTIRTRGVLTEFHGQREVRTTKIWKVNFLNDEIHRIAEVAIVYRNLEEYEKRQQSKASRKLHSKFPTAPSLSIAGCSTAQEQRKSVEDKGHNLISKLQKNCGTSVSRNLFSKTTIEFEDATFKNKSKATGNETESYKREKERLCKTVGKNNVQHGKITKNKLKSTTRTHSQEYEETAVQDEVKNFHGLETEIVQTNSVKNSHSSSDISDTQNNVENILNPDSKANRNNCQPCQTKTSNLSLSGAHKQEDSYDVLWKERSCEQPVLNQQQQRKQEYSNIHTGKATCCKEKGSQRHKNHAQLPTKAQFCRRQITLSREEERNQKICAKRKDERQISYSQEDLSRPRNSCMAPGKIEFYKGETPFCEEQENEEETGKGQTSYREEEPNGGRQMDSSKTLAIYDDRFCKQQSSFLPKKEIKHSANSEIIERAFDDSMEDILRSMPIASHDQSGSRCTVTRKQNVASSNEDDCSVECFINSGSGDLKSNQNISQTHTVWNEEGKYLKEKVYNVIETLTKWDEDLKKLKQDMECIARNIEKWDEEGKKLNESVHYVKVKCFPSPENQRCHSSNNEEHTILDTENKETSLESEHRVAAVPQVCNKNRKRSNKDEQIFEDNYNGLKLREKRIKTYTQ